MSDTTRDAIREYMMTWKIKNFGYAFRDIISEPFISRNFNNTKFYLRVGREGPEDDKKITISIAACKSAIDLPSLDYEVALVTLDGLPEYSLKEENFIFVKHLNPLVRYDVLIKKTLVVPEKTVFQERRNNILPHDTLTIRCKLQQRGTEIPESEESFMASSIGVRRKLFFWTLNQFSSGWKDMHTTLVTRWGEFGTFKLNASIKAECEGEESVFIEVHRDKGDAAWSTIKVSLLATHGTERKLAKEAFLFEKCSEFEMEQVWQSMPLISKNELIAAKDLLLPNDSLSLKCEFTSSLGMIAESEMMTHPGELNSLTNGSIFSSSEENGKLPSASLQKDFKCMLDTGSLSDLKLKVDSKVFPVHKAVLGARSPIFNAMFTNDFKERSNGEVLIEDIDADTIRGFLIYLYSDTIDNLTMEKAVKLYCAADKYGVRCLKKVCASFLKANLSSVNACVVLNLADQRDDKELKAVAQDFIRRHDSEILHSDDWKDLEIRNQTLVVETFRKICLNKSTK